MWAGRHSAPGFATTDGGLVIDLGPLKAIHVDPARRIAWVQPGVLWGELDAATQEHGLAVTGGRVSSTGVAGFTLGSGSGWLERKMGLAADNLRAARVLTADGRVVDGVGRRERRPVLGAARRRRQLRDRRRVRVRPAPGRPDRPRRDAAVAARARRAR